jgi:tetrahydromethanopterin S-methyltransferase subunit G
MTTDERLDAVMSRLKEIADRLAAIDNRLERVDTYLLQFRAEVTGRLEIIENRLDTISSVMMSLDSRLHPITKAVLDFGSVASRLILKQARIEEKVSKLVDPAA